MGVRGTGAAVLIALTWLVAGLASPAGAASTVPPPAPPTTIAPPKAYILIDANTGAVLTASADRTPRPPASLTKVLTALAASAVLPHDGKLTVSARAAAQPANKVGANAGEVWPIVDAMHVMLLQSANDMALAFAEAVGGTAEGFQDVLTRTGTAIGMQDPQTWRDPAGLDDAESVGGGNLVSARDLAIAGRAFIADPWLSPISAKPRYSFTAPDGVVHDALNHNKMVLGRYPGAIGGKTGYTRKAGNSLLASAQRNGRTMVAVVMDTKDEYGFTSALFDRGFATPVAAEGGLEHLPPLRLPAATAIRPASQPAAQDTAPDPPVEQAVDPIVVIPDQTSDVAPAPVENVDAEGPGSRIGLPLIGVGLAVVGLALGLGRGGARRRRRHYYKVPTRAGRRS